MFMGVSAIVILVALTSHYYFSWQLAEDAAAEQFIAIAEKSSFQAVDLERRGISFAYALQNNQSINHPVNNSQQHPLIKQMANLLNGHGGIFSLFIGYENGDYLEVSNLEADKGLRSIWNASPEDRWIVIQIFNHKQRRVKITSYLDDQFQIRRFITEDSDYRANERAWYIDAKKEKVSKTLPYMLKFARRPGISYAIRTDYNSVVGSITLLSSLNQLLKNNKFPATSRSVLFDKNGFITAYHTGGDNSEDQQVKPIELSRDELLFVRQNPVIKVANMMDYPPYEFAVAGNPRGYSIDLFRLLAKKIGININFVNGYSFTELMQKFEQNEIDLMLTMMKTEQREQLGLFSRPVIKPQIVAVTSTQPGRSITQLSDLDGLKIAAQKNYAVTAYIKEQMPDQNYIEFADTRSALEALNNGSVDVVLDNQNVVEYVYKYFALNNINISEPLAEFNNNQLFAMHYLVSFEKSLLIDMLNRAYEDLKPEYKLQLNNKWLNSNNETKPVMSSSENGQMPHPDMLSFASNPQTHEQLKQLEIEDKLYYVYVSPIKGYTDKLRREFVGLIVEQDEVLQPYKQQLKLSTLITFFILLLLTSMVYFATRFIVHPIQKVIGENDKVRNRNYQKVRYIPTHIKELHQLSQSMVTMSEAICDYEIAQQELMDSFIKLIARAIDKKSPYTGGHCERVPKLAIMLAKAASEQQQASYKDFRFDTDDQWREFRIAAWLHDCGKIITPEHIVDKGSKLETIYNRIHEIRMRFEVLWRDAEIDYWKQVADKPEDKEQLKAKLDQQQAQIKQDFAFVAACNVGGEFMEASDLQRLKEIAEKTWIRNLDNRLGLSPQEELALSDYSHTTPQLEKLLEDKPEHIRYRDSSDKSDEQFDFTLKPTEAVRNLGEVYNLSIQRGTLTDEDRYIINEHIVTTIQMLETLPLPKELVNVPEYAGGHHETMDGTGYPRSLTSEQLSVPAKIMAIADIFEALTASDRPYKKAKTLSQSLSIMKQMALDNHIDRDLFKLFIDSAVYLEYAERFLKPDQIDAIQKDSLINEL
jgi:HD-GYP domain-containing protein (c-di-GMP phosphodiesterase class II)